MADVTISQIPTTITVQQVGIQGPAGSQGTGSFDTGSLMVTGSVTGNVLTFTKGDGSTFDLTVSSNSGGTPDIPLNSFQFNESGDFGGSAMYYDKYNERVGINITTPQADLHVRGASNGTGSILLETDSTGVEEKAIAALYFRVSDNDGANYKKFAVIAENTGSAFGAGRLHFAVNDQTGSTANAEIADSKLTLDYDGSVYMPDLHAGTQKYVIGYDSASGELTFYSTSSFVSTAPAATFDSSSLMVTGSVNSNVLTFTKGDGSTFSLTVNTGSLSREGAFSYSSISDQIIIPAQNTNNSSTAINSTILSGRNNTLRSNAYWSITGGSNNDVAGATSFVYGVSNETFIDDVTIFGYNNTAHTSSRGQTGDLVYILGDSNETHLARCFVAGMGNTVRDGSTNVIGNYGLRNTVIGDANTVDTVRGTVLGSENNMTHVDSTIIGFNLNSVADNTVHVENLHITGSVDISQTITLESQAPLPNGTAGMLAVSASGANEKLYFYDGSSWREVSLL